MLRDSWESWDGPLYLLSLQIPGVTAYQVEDLFEAFQTGKDTILQRLRMILLALTDTYDENCSPMELYPQT